MPTKTGGRGEHIASGRRLAAVEKQRQALALRTAGATYEAIAEKLGYGSSSGAHKAVLVALRNTLKEPAEELRTLELKRLDQAQLAIAQLVQRGDLKAIDRWIRIIDQRSKLLGLNAPIEMKVQEIVQTKVESELNLLFESIASDPEIPADAKRKIFEAATNLEARQAVASEN